MPQPWLLFPAMLIYLVNLSGCQSLTSGGGRVLFLVLVPAALLVYVFWRVSRARPGGRRFPQGVHPDYEQDDDER